VATCRIFSLAGNRFPGRRNGMAASMRALAGCRFAMLALCANLLAMPAMAGSIGVVSEVNGTARLLRGTDVLEAARGVDLQAQDIAETDTNSSLQLDMEDGSVLRLGPMTRLSLTEYRLADDRALIDAGIDLLTGWLRFAVTKLRRTQASYTINMPTLTVGIRGTEGVVESDARQGSLHLLSGAVEVSAEDLHVRSLPVAHVNAGEYIARLQGGMFQKPATPPASFQRRLPPALREPALPKGLTTAGRGVAPRVIRTLTRGDAEALVRKHPHASERLRQRFQPLFAPQSRRAPETRAPQGSGFVPGSGSAPGAHGQIVPSPAGHATGLIGAPGNQAFPHQSAMPQAKPADSPGDKPRLREMPAGVRAAPAPSRDATSKPLPAPSAAAKPRAASSERTTPPAPASHKPGATPVASPLPVPHPANRKPAAGPESSTPDPAIETAPATKSAP